MEWLLLVLSILLGAGKSVLSKSVNLNGGGLKQTMKANTILFSFAFCFAGVFVVFSVKEWNLPWLLVIAYAVCVLFSQISLMKAVEWGSVAISSLFYSCGFMIPTIWGCIYFKEGVNVLHVIGILLILISFVCSVERKKGEKLNAKWLIAALGGTLFSGLVGVIQKLFGGLPTTYSLDLFLFASFAVIIVLSGITYCIYLVKDKLKRKEKEVVESENTTKLNKPTAFLLTVLLGVVMGGINKLNTYLAGVLPSVIMFPSINGGVIVAAAIFSAVIFKEKLSKKQIVSILIGFIAIIIIAIGQNI